MKAKQLLLNKAIIKYYKIPQRYQHEYVQEFVISEIQKYFKRKYRLYLGKEIIIEAIKKRTEPGWSLRNYGTYMYKVGELYEIAMRDIEEFKLKVGLTKNLF